MTEDQFKPLRLMNGLYLQLHAYMLRVAIPYGDAERRASCASWPTSPRTYDKGYGHFTTRTNLQLHWIKLRDAPDILDAPGRGRAARHPDLGQLHPQRHRRPLRRRRRPTRSTIRASGPRRSGSGRPSTRNSRFLPRKFKIAVTASAKPTGPRPRSTTSACSCSATTTASWASRCMVGGGLGRTPYLGPTIREHLPARHLLSYLQAILRVYNRHGRRDNIYKARIKILVASLGAEEFARQVEAEWAKIDKAAGRPARHRAGPHPRRLRAARLRDPAAASRRRSRRPRPPIPAFARFARNNVAAAQGRPATPSSTSR